MAIIRFSNNRYEGLSSDTKPTNVPANSVFYETDTRNFWDRISGAWTKRPNITTNFQVTNIYDVYKISSTYYITNKRTNITTSGSDFAALIQAVLDAMTSPAYAEFNFDASDFELDDPIAIPLSSTTVKKSVVFNGWFSENRDWGTRLHPSSTFPTTRYLVEGIAADGSSQFPDFVMDGFHLYTHPDYARALAGTALNGGATVIDCGGIKLEFSIYARMTTNIRNISTGYMWRGLHLLGKCWYIHFENFMFQDANANFSGNADIILENGNHTLDTGNPTVKACHFKNIRSFHTGEMDYGMLIKSGNYNSFYDVHLEGNAYRTAIFALDNSDDASINAAYTIGSNQFYRISSLDNNTVPSPDNREACLYLDGAGTIDNIFKDARFTSYPNAVKFANSCKNNLVEISAHYGVVPVINDAGSGVNNTLVLQGGHRTATTQTKITTSNSIVRIIDNRDNVNARGISTQSGTGTETAFVIAHGLITTPVNYDVKPISNDAFGNYDLTVDGTNITITYAFAPPNDTNNLKWSWYADVY